MRHTLTSILDNFTESVFGLSPAKGTSGSAIRQALARGTSSFVYQRRKASLSGVSSFDNLNSVTPAPNPAVLQKSNQ